MTMKKTQAKAIVRQSVNITADMEEAEEREQNSLTAKITAVIEMHFQVINKRLLLMENCNMQKVLSSLLMHFAIRRKRCGCILFFFFFFFFVATGFFYLSI